MSPKENFENPSKFLEKYCSRALKKNLKRRYFEKQNMKK